MAQFSVTFQQLKNAIDQLTQLNDQFGARVEDLANTEASLCAMWEGQAKDTFDAAFKRDKGQMDVFKATVHQYIVALQGALDQYLKAEQENTTIASTRTYN